MMELTLRINKEAGTKVVRLFQGSYKELACEVSYQGETYRVDIPALSLQDLFTFVRSARIPPVGGCGFGLDGVSYELTIEDGLAHATYRWWMTPASEWTPLAKIADWLLLLGDQASFRVSRTISYY